MSRLMPHGDLIANDFVLPSQTVASPTDSPERRLLRAIFEQAKDDLRDNTLPYWRQDAIDWFRADDREWVYSFTRICDESAVRAALFGTR